jgi:hypothetical protein
MVLCGFLAFAICFAAMAARSGVSAIAFATAAAAGVALGVEGVRLVPFHRLRVIVPREYGGLWLCEVE